MERIELRPPPALTSADAGGALMSTLPVLGSLGSIGLVATMAGGPRQYVGIGLFVAAAILVAVGQLGRQRRQRRLTVDAARRDYLAHLVVVRDVVRAAGEIQRAAAVSRHPPPVALPALAECGAWRPGDGLTVRYGVADLPVDAAPATPEIGARADPFCAAAVRRLATAHATRPDLPATLDLARVEELSASPGTARALVCSAAACPDVAVAVLASSGRRASWDWVKWLPQASSPVSGDALGPRRLVAGAMSELAPLLPERRHLLLVVDGVPPPALDRPGTLLVVAETLTADGRPLPGVADDCPLEVAEAFARRCGVASDPAFPTAPDWSARTTADRLRVLLGTSDAGDTVALDLKESALGGSGPHGMVIGATGSGKSELLRALVLRLALSHPPDDLNLVLIDFKGGAAFDGLARLPHVSALITNLADEESLLDRMADALTSELVRRQEHVRATGDRGGLPTLLVVVDEFAELLATRPELDELFVTLGRLGRGLGIHLLLASQRLDDGRWRGLESHLSYRIGLRTFTAEESRAVLGVVDAYELPATPGLGYLRTAPGRLLRFRAPYAGHVLHHAPDPPRALAFTAAPVDGPALAAVTVVEAAVEAAVAAMPGHGGAHRIWLPPLDRPAALGELLPDLAVDPARGFGQRRATVPLGEVDRPRLQRRERLEVDLTADHVAVVGAAGTGRSTLLRTAVAALALTRTPEEVAIHLLDLGGALAPLAGLPHVAGVAGRDQAELAGRIVAELGAVADRPTLLVVDDWAALREHLPDLEDAVAGLVAHGRALGVRVLATAHRWLDLRASVRDGFDTRIELRLGDPLDSEIDRRLAAAVPRGRPGRGLAEGAHFLAALPRLDGADGPGGTDDALGELVARVADHWHGPTPPRLRDLPLRVDLVDLPDGPDAPGGAGIRLGLRAGDHSVRTLPQDAHLIVLGDGGSGRTCLLRTIVQEVARVRPEDRLLIVDPRGAHAGTLAAVATEHLLAHVTGDPSAPVAELAGRLAARLGGRCGRDVWLVIDDLDLLPSTAWQPLLPFLARAVDVGLHVVVARRTGGAARAFYEPLLGTLRDLRSPGVLLSGSAEEGPLLAGVRARTTAPGRARWVSPSGEEGPFQVAWTEP
jgi:S-DNA-T family DNA segregation ATPase FtsK/SpoIIIE